MIMKKTALLFVLILSCAVLSAQESRMFRRGYRGNLEIGNYAVFGKDKVGGIAQMTTTQGFSFGDGAFVGLGLGLGVDLNGSFFFPVFLDAKYNFIDRRTSPFAAVRTGLRYGPDEEYVSYGISLGGGMDFGRYSIRVGYEYSVSKTTTYVQHGYANQYVKPNFLFCSFAFNF